MSIPLWFAPTPAGMLASAACVVAGGPLFADGLRALRLRRALRGLPPRGGDALEPGVRVLRGDVAVDAPLVAPLSGRVCAGYALELRAADGPYAARIFEGGAFTLATAGGEARVEGVRARLDLRASAERAVERAAELGVVVARLAQGNPEARWLVARGGPLHVTERALVQGATVCVLGCVRHADAIEQDELEWAATGTDGAPVAGADREATPWRISGGGVLDHVVVSDDAIDLAAHVVPAWRATGAIAGPALGLAGLLQLAHAAAPLVGGGS